MFWILNVLPALVLLVHLADGSTPHTNNPPHCTDPAEEVLDSQWRTLMSQQSVQYGFGLQHVVPYQMIHEYMGIVENKTTCSNTEPVPGSSLCGPDLTPAPTTCNNARWSEVRRSDDVGVRSICPYTFKKVQKFDRYPQSLMEANCACPRCQYMGEDFTGACERVFYNQPILRRTTEVLANGTCVFEPALHPLAVGCTCAVTSTSGSTE